MIFFNSVLFRRFPFVCNDGLGKRVQASPIVPVSGKVSVKRFHGVPDFPFEHRFRNVVCAADGAQEGFAAPVYSRLIGGLAVHATVLFSRRPCKLVEREVADRRLFLLRNCSVFLRLLRKRSGAFLRLRHVPAFGKRFLDCRLQAQKVDFIGSRADILTRQLAHDAVDPIADHAPELPVCADDPGQRVRVGKIVLAHDICNQLVLRIRLGERKAAVRVLVAHCRNKLVPRRAGFLNAASVLHDGSDVGIRATLLDQMHQLVREYDGVLLAGLRVQINYTIFV